MHAEMIVCEVYLCLNSLKCTPNASLDKEREREML